MSNEVKKSPWKSVNAWATVLTIITGVAGVFGVAANVADADQLTGVIADAQTAIETKNFYLLASLVISSGNFLWHRLIKPLLGK